MIWVILYMLISLTFSVVIYRKVSDKHSEFIDAAFSVFIGMLWPITLPGVGLALLVIKLTALVNKVIDLYRAKSIPIKWFNKGGL